MAATETQKVAEMTEADKAKAEAEAKVATLNPTEMVGALVAATEMASKAKDAKAESIESKMAKAARLLLTTPDAFGIEANTPAMPKGVVTWLEGASGLSADAFDRLEGDLVASILSNLNALPVNFRPAGFAEVADKVTEAVDAWNATRPGRRASSGEAKERDASQFLASFGIKCVNLTLASDKLEGSPIKMRRTSTWSDLTAEINKASKAIDGKLDAAPGQYSYQKVDASAGPAWRAWAEAAKADPTAKATFDVKLAKGTLRVTLEAEKA